MNKVFTQGKYTGIHYPDYFKTPWWKHLKVELIYSNPDAKCWICKSRERLLLHHEIYNLFCEKLNRDIFILCFDCHTKLHFYKMFGFLKRKTKLHTPNLKRRRLSLMVEECIRNKRYLLSLWYVLVRIMA